MSRWLAVSLLVAGACAGGCGGDGISSTPPDGNAVDGVAPDGWTTLIERQWTLPRNTEQYRCRRIQVTQDMYITGFRSMSPPGTHHTVLTVSDTATPLNDYDCDAGNLDKQMLFAAGLNSDDLLFPDGVAIKLTAGQYINLNLHISNSSDDAATETSGVLVKTASTADVRYEADAVFAGRASFSIAPNPMPQAVSGSCAVPTSWNVFSLWPHMHHLATHQLVVLRRAGVVVKTLLDSDYAFDNQRNYPMTQMTMQTGDELQVTCTYVNTTGMMVLEGDSTNEEMCFTGMYKWPKGGGLYACVE